jgi:hypothetical protein
MQEPFPALRSLVILSDVKTAPVIPDSLMGGSAPHLQFLGLKRILFPGLSNFLLSATDLLYLDLRRIPHSGYISPEAMATCLSVLTRLTVLHLEFESPRSRESRRLPTATGTCRSVLPALIWLHFNWGQEIFGRSRGPDRCPSAQAPRNKIPPSAHI